MMNFFHSTSVYCAHLRLSFCYVSWKMVLDDADSLRIFDNFHLLYNDKLWPNLTMKTKLITSIKVLSFRKLVGFGWKVSLSEKCQGLSADPCDFYLLLRVKTDLKLSKATWEDKTNLRGSKISSEEQICSEKIEFLSIRVVSHLRGLKLILKDQIWYKSTKLDSRGSNLI